jgi:hypothetical protein
MQDMHVRGWTILAVSVFSFLILLYVAHLVRRMHKSVDRLDLTSDKFAKGEAMSAHARIDRLDQDFKADRVEVTVLRAMFNKLKGQVQFLMHKEISTELTKIRDPEDDTQ